MICEDCGYESLALKNGYCPVCYHCGDLEAADWECEWLTRVSAFKAYQEARKDAELWQGIAQAGLVASAYDLADDWLQSYPMFDAEHWAEEYEIAVAMAERNGHE